MATASEKAAAKKAEAEALQEEKRLDRIRRLAIHRAIRVRRSFDILRT